jgi:hypothetical protein
VRKWLFWLFWLFLVALFAALWCLSASEPSKENAFAAEYNEWVRLRESAPAGTLSAPAVRQWKRVKQAWRELQHSVE